MEICNTYNNVTARGEGRGKAPTRLQKHAPACLQLDQTAGTASTNPLLDDASMAIPLLSPVFILSHNQCQSRAKKAVIRTSLIVVCRLSIPVHDCEPSNDIRDSASLLCRTKWLGLVF
ncbi:hypothetical protein Pyn_10966 [Prunus yedoensis var. nudiflora]|uniref:Uncharacterized protein n=1 Tax=Prunus yedoensis var. nudiflora TaxID=2094558 RepID=A0A314V569_PRUYE|nr:hypothetical protein Pyn_10966 [Prunus yedoensis var. nudiflora]